jgi:rhodanese-related sulfurtransferase
MRVVWIALSFSVALLWSTASLAQQPRFPIDQNKVAVGAKEKTPEELKQMMASGSKFMLIDVNPKAQFEKDTIPGAVNIPLEEIDEGLKKIPKDSVLVFACNRGPRSSQAAKIAEAAGFTSTTFCPIMKWKDDGNSTEPGKSKS